MKTQGAEKRRISPLFPFQYLVYLVFRAGEAIIGVLPLRACAWLGATLGHGFYLLAPQYRRLARRNLRIAFGDQYSEPEIRALIRGHFRALGRNLLCGIKLPLMPTEEVESRITFEDQEHILNALAHGKGVIGAIAHLGNWELLSQIPSLVPGARLGTLFQPLGNPILNQHVIRRRAKANVALFDRSSGFYAPLRHLREGGGVGILSDQHAGDRGLWCPFFGRLASTTNLPALFSLKTGAPIVPFGVIPNGPGRWKVVYLEPIFPPESGKRDSNEAAIEITAKVNQAIETLIRKQPEEWFWVHNRWHTPNPNFLLNRYKRGLYLPGNYAGAAPLKPFRLLVRSPNPLGDACMAVPAIRAIKAGRPDLHLTILCRENLTPIWKAVEEVDHILAVPKAASASQVAAEIRTLPGFDAAVLMPNSLSSAVECWKAKIPHIAGYAGHSRRWLMHQIIPEPNETGHAPRHHAYRYLHMAERMGASVEDVDLLPEVPQPLSSTPPDIYHLSLCPGAEYGAAKRWPIERFAEAASRISSALPACRWTVYGSPAEAEIGEQFVELYKGKGEATNLAGKTTVAELMEGLKQSHALLTNDTGTMHLAALLGVPTVSVFGSTEPTLTRAIGPNHVIMRRHVECSPCFLRDCPLDFRCMLELEPVPVAEAMLRLLPAVYGGSPEPAALVAG